MLKRLCPLNTVVEAFKVPEVLYKMHETRVRIGRVVEVASSIVVNEAVAGNVRAKDVSWHTLQVRLTSLSKRPRLTEFQGGRKRR